MRTGLLVLGLVILVGVLAQCGCVFALGVDTNHLSPSFSFDKPKAPDLFFKTTDSFKINNPENTTINFTVSKVEESNIRIIPSPSSGKIARRGSVPITLTIEVNSGLPEGDYERTIEVNPGGIIIYVNINVKHKTELVVSPLTINFGSVDVDEEVQKQVTFKERLGYKPLTVSLSWKEGNNWVRPSDNHFTIPASGSKSIYFTLSKNKPGWKSYKKSYSWSYSVRSEGGNYETSLRTDLKLPPKLSLDSSAYEKIIFDRPKSEKPTFYRDVKIGVGNKGYYSMSVKDVSKSGFGDLNVRVKSKPSSVGGYSCSNIILSVEAPYDTEERSYAGKVHVDCGEAGSGYASVTIKIEQVVSLYVSPTTIDFNGVEILTEEKEMKVTLSETLGYKSVRDITIGKIRGPAWISVSPTSFYGIPPEESDTATFALFFRGEAIVGKVSNWEYVVESANAGTHKIIISAEALPPDLSVIYNDLGSINQKDIYKRSEAKEVVSESITVLDISKAKELSGEDWGHVISVATQTATALKSMDEFTGVEGEEKGRLFPKLLVATTLTQFVKGSAVSIADSEIRSHATKASSALESLIKGVLTEAALYFEDVGRDSEASNCLEAVKAYSSAAEAYELLGNPKKAEGYNIKTSVFSEKHDNLVTIANDGRVQAEMEIAHHRSKLSEIAGSAVLLNPFAYERVSTGYDFANSKYSKAIKRYELAGEKRMAEDSSNRLTELKEEWKFLWTAFCIYMIILTFLFSFIVFRLTKGTADFLRDSAEERLGDVVSGLFSMRG
ncbi:MAG: hypothetical protein KAX20_00320 [Candidatus Omnitrophica bacterium]|nr:hypothetical protein [Candidatus Omnitrophota bacterium]